MKCITFSLNYIQYPILMSVFQFLQSFSGKNFQSQSFILIPILSATSHLLAILHNGIIILKEKVSSSVMIDHRRRNAVLEKETTIIRSSSFKFNFIPSTAKLKKPKVAGYFILLGLANICPHLLYMRYAKSEIFGSFQSFVNILFTSLFCYLMLRTKLYSHHYLALTIFAIDIGLYLGFKSKLVDLTKVIEDNYINWGTFFLITFLYIIPTSIREVLEKFLMENVFVSSLKILLFEGVFLLIVFILYSLIIQNIPCGDKMVDGGGILNDICFGSQWDIIYIDLKMGFSNTLSQTVWVCMYIIGVYFASFFRVETINKLSPTHRFVCEMLSQLYWFIYNNAIKDGTAIKYNLIWLDILQIVLLLIACCLFNEIVIIQVCKLGKNTKKEIKKRALNDIFLTLADGEENELMPNGNFGVIFD